MLGGEDRLLAFFLEALEESVDLDLVIDVEVKARLVEEEERCPLGQGPRDEDPLALAAAQVRHPLFRQSGGLREAHSLPDGLLIFRGQPLEACLAGIEPHADDVSGGELEDRLGKLGDVGDLLGDLAPPQEEHVLTLEGYPAFDVAEKTLDGPDERTFPRAVPAEDGHKIARLEAQRYAADDEAVPVARGQIIDLEDRHGRLP